MAEEADGGAAKLILGRLGLELVVQQRLEHYVHVHEVLLACLRKDQDVIAVHLNEALEHGRAGVQGAGRWPKTEYADAKVVLAAGDSDAERRLELIGLADEELHVSHH